MEFEAHGRIAPAVREKLRKTAPFCPIVSLCSNNAPPHGPKAAVPRVKSDRAVGQRVPSSSAPRQATIFIAGIAVVTPVYERESRRGARRALLGSGLSKLADRSVGSTVGSGQPDFAYPQTLVCSQRMVSNDDVPAVPPWSERFVSFPRQAL